MMLIVCQAGAQRRNDEIRVRAKPFEPIILETSSRFDVDPYLLWTIAYLESAFNPRAISYKDGKPCGFGLMQFTESTATKYRLRNPYDPEQAIDAAARYVKALTRRFGGRFDLVLAAYNSGEGTVEAFQSGKTLTLSNGKVINPRSIKTGGIPPYKETQAYVARGTLIYRRLSLRQNSSTTNALRINSKTQRSQLSIYVTTDQMSNRQFQNGSKASQRQKALSIYPN